MAVSMCPPCPRPPVHHVPGTYKDAPITAGGTPALRVNLTRIFCLSLWAACGTAIVLCPRPRRNRHMKRILSITFALTMLAALASANNGHGGDQGYAESDTI